MALTVVLYVHNKKTNSTCRPSTNNAHSEVTGVMIDGADILHPKISIKPLIPTATPIGFNYAYIENFSKRYYYIDNWVFDSGRWVAFMSVDVLASYKEDIGVSEQYILRSASKKDVTICDMLYPATTDSFITQNDVTLSANTFYKTDGEEYGVYIVGVINRDENTPGSVSYYAFNSAQIRKLSSQLMGNFSWLNIDSEVLSEELSKALINPFQYIVSCMWFPMLPTIERNISGLPFGWWSLTNVTCSVMKSTKCNYYIGSFDIFNHPETEDSSASYLNANPYTHCSVIIEPWGSVEIPLKPQNYAHTIYCDVDFITGKGILTIKNGTGFTVVRREAQVGVPIQLSQMYVDVGRAVMNAVGTVGGVVNSAISGNLGGAISSVVSGIYSTMEAGTPNLSTKGADGSFLAYNILPYVITKHSLTVARDNARFGSPYSKKDTVSNHSGYLLCGNPSITLTEATPFEIESVNNHLATGFFYE